MLRTSAFARLLLILTSVSLAAQVQLPKTPVRDVTDEYFGTKVVDPYRWLEKTDDPEVAAWMKDQGDAGTVFDKPLLVGEEATLIPTGAGKAKAKSK